MPISVFAIYFVVVSTGYQNPPDTANAYNVEDRGNNYQKFMFLLFYIFDLSKKIQNTLTKISFRLQWLGIRTRRNM